jgi:sugar lactone lactonase YvrE
MSKVYLLGVALIACACSDSANMTAPKSQVLDVSLWVANGSNVLEFAPGALKTMGLSGSAPTKAINSAVFGAPQGVVFDATGDLWVIDGGTTSMGGSVAPALYEFKPGTLKAAGANAMLTPDNAIHSSGFTFIQQAVFDKQGNLWVTDNGGQMVDVFTSAQVAAGGMNVTPATMVSSNPAFTGPLGIVFDASGNLYVANNASTTIFEFTAGMLPAVGAGAVTLAPAYTLSDNGHGSIQGPWALIFDAAGDLWSSNANAPNTVVEFGVSSLGQSGSPTPMTTLSAVTVGGDPSLDSPNGIAFDNLGDLAAINSLHAFGIPFFAKTLLTAGGAKVPTLFTAGATTTLNAPAGCNFGPVY